MKVYIVKSGSFICDKDSDKVLQETVNEFISNSDDKIINIQLVEFGGLKRFYIYVQDLEKDTTYLGPR